MDSFARVLPIIIYLLLIVLLVVAIIIGIKLIITMNKLERLVDDVNKKAESLNGVFAIINAVSNKANFIYERLVDIVGNILDKVLTKNKGRREKDE